jgi:hypothetical protein
VVPAPLVALAIALTPFAASASGAQDPDRVAAWREDVDHLVAELERLHPDPYFAVSREEFRAAADALLARVPDVTDDEVVVELMRLVALVSREGRDGHTAVWPVSFRMLPLQLYRFSDGWFVVHAPPLEARLVGARLLRVGGVDVEEACRRIAPVLTRDNGSNLLAKTTMMLLSTELLHVLAMTEDRSRAKLVLQGPKGEPFEVELAGQTPQEYASWNAFPPQDLPADEDVLWRSSGRGRFWMEVLEERATLYVHYAEVQADDGRGGSLAEFTQDLVREFEEQGLERVVVDVRRNRGGDNTTFDPLIEGLRSSAAIDRRGALFVLTGRDTFSAAGNFVTAVQERTNALLVGEPAGGAPNQYGDVVQVALPNRPEVLVLVSTRYHEFGGPDDDHLSHEPDVPAALSSADWFAGRDPVLEAAITWTE